MTQKIAVAVIHGIGKQTATFADALITAITARCRPDCGDDVVIRSVHWSPVLQAAEDVLWERMREEGSLHLPQVRRFLIDFLGDALAYQPTPSDRTVYDAVHRVFADTLRLLADEAGADAPLCVIAHSAGSVIASNYLYDLQMDNQKGLIAETVRDHIGTTSLEWGETLALLYTLGSPLALWSMRYPNFGRPIRFPAPELATHYPALAGEWVNYYDADDIVGYPLRTLNEFYEQVVTRDAPVNVGSLLQNWNPLSHFGYWEDRDIVEPIARKLIEAWAAINAGKQKSDSAESLHG